jgi:subtilase family serine protease
MARVKAAKRIELSMDGCHKAAVGAAAVRRMIAALVLLGGIGTVAAHGQSLVQNRITAPIRSDQMQAVHGTVPPIIAKAQDEGALSGSTFIQGMSIIFRRSAAQEADLKNLLQEQQTKGSPVYHQWLGPGQFAARYGVSQQDLAKVSAWLQSQGFALTSIPASADRIVFSGTAAQVNAAFQTQMHRYMFRGQSQWANAAEVSVPQAIAGITLRVAHLSTFRPLPHLNKRSVHVAQQMNTASLSPQYTLCNSNQSPCPAGDIVNFIAPSDIQTIYDLNGLYNVNNGGGGQTMAIVGQTDITQYQNDIASFRTLSGLNASNLPTQILVPNTGAAAVSVGDLEEADIDVEWSGAVAENASILYVTVGSDQSYSVFDSLQYAVQTPLVNNRAQLVPVISISYGGCEQVDISSSAIQQLESVLEQANAQGQTVVASSGDDGSADCDDTDSSSTPTAASHGLAVDYPASSWYVTATGGTSFSGDLTDQSKYWNSSNNAKNGSAISYIPETTWNDTPDTAGLSSAGSLSASGGGASSLFAKPSWQAGLGVPNDGQRDVPDVALAADPNHDGYVLCTEETNSAGTQLTGTSSCGGPVPYFDAKGQGYLYGGTSIAAPQFAAMITLWNQVAGNAAGAGNVNPILYQTAQNTPGAFHDVTTGSNAVVCQANSPGCISNGAGGYVMSCCNAGSGYDKATGLGSVEAATMGTVWPKILVSTSPPVPSPTFSIVPKQTSLTVAAGGSGTVGLTLTPSGGFNGTVTFACSGLPAGASCSFAPASVNISSTAVQTITLTVASSASARLVTSQPFHRNWPMESVFAGIFGISLLGVGRKRRFPSRWASRFMGVCLLVAGLAAGTMMMACGGGGSGSPPPSGSGNPTPTSTTSTITVTGTSTHTTVANNIELTIT